MDRLAGAGLGQDYDSMALSRTSEAWLAAGNELRRHVAHRLSDVTTHVEVVGSSSVLGLLAKPIIDLAVGVPVDQTLSPIAATLENDG